MSITDSLPETEEQKEMYRKEAARLIAGYERQRRMRSQQVPSRNIVRFRKIWYAVAATILFGLFIPAAYLYLKPKTEQIAVVPSVEMSTHRGEIKTIFLPDQTKVTLNAESRLTFPVGFAGHERSVELQGEALFEVTSDHDRPFTVTTADMKVSVLGTVFDVKAYTDDGSLMVSVASGKVEVGLTGKAGKIGETGETGRTSSVLLEKNHLLKIDKATGNFEKLTIDADKYLLWTDGTLYFHRTPIREVVNILNRQFPQMNIELAESEYTNLISGEHDQHPEAALISIIYSTGLKYKQTGNKIIIYKDNKNE